jgi:prepilin-type N-terminal cleavage/methylation domain-containing protein
VGRRGFTLIELLVTIMLVAIALVGVMGGLRALSEADLKARKADLLQKLAAQKLEEIGVVIDPRSGENGGDFSEQGYPDITWTMDVQPGTEADVDQVTITATQGADSQSLTGLVFIRPTTGSVEP